MTITWVANRSPRSERATALGVQLAENRAALRVVPTMMGAIAGTAGITAIFVVVAISLAAGGLLSHNVMVSGAGDIVRPTGGAPNTRAGRPRSRGSRSTVGARSPTRQRVDLRA